VKTAIIDDYLEVALESADWNAVRERSELIVFSRSFATEEALVEALADCEIVCVMRERTAFPARILTQLPRLRLIVTTGMGNGAIDMVAAREGGICVCGTHGPHTPTAELAFGLLLSLARDIPSQARALEEGGWQTRLGRDIAGAQLGIVGLGKLGGKVAAYGRAFGMNVVAWSENLTQARCEKVGAVRVDKSTLFETSDYVSLHLRLSDRTRGIVDAAAIRRMRSDAFFVNTARAELVDQVALVDALSTRRIAGAAIDVFDEEPLPGTHPFRGLPNVLLTPHLGYVTQATFRQFYRESVEAVSAFLDGTPVRVIN
jgi:D-3-phosphoglycerate dehydrogenase